MSKKSSTFARFLTQYDKKQKIHTIKNKKIHTIKKNKKNNE